MCVFSSLLPACTQELLEKTVVGELSEQEELDLNTPDSAAEVSLVAQIFVLGELFLQQGGVGCKGHVTALQALTSPTIVTPNQHQFALSGKV